MATWSDFLPRVMPDVAGCPIPRAESAIRDAVIEFCQKTRVWKDVVPFETDADYREGYVAVPSTSRLVAVLSLIEEGVETDIPEGLHIRADRANLWFLDEQETISIEALVALRPKETTTSCPDFIFNDHAETIAFGAKARLLYGPKDSWASPQLAVVAHQMFQKGIVQERIRIHHGYGDVSKRVKPRRFI